MSYCWRCGTELPEGARFCPKCGANVSGPEKGEMTGLGRISYEAGLQDHWIRRIVAIIIDSVIVGAIAWVLNAILFLPVLFTAGWPSFWASPWNWIQFPFAMGLIYIFYFTITESIYGYTVGKKLMNLRVVTLNGQTPNLEKAFIRNISNVYWIFLLLDVIGGLATSGDPRQKYTDRIASTVVV
ncbi:MAG: RDD family protein [Nitrososphaerales archaeon]|nr:RDD family protein [Nitrososphaerales archaeon]